MLFLACVNYEQDRDAAGGADRMPPLLFVNYAIRYETTFGSSKIRAAVSKTQYHVFCG
jgi:hypothetical protein